jgi:hypothetical protein
MAEEWGQVSSITHHLASIIREYPDGTSLLYEVIELRRILANCASLIFEVMSECG